ncbi:LCP family protein [Planomicrobium sp. YIM 101495]|uniref:LCP family glycopolymer transferase n=1 Tax=Planomicrobium sp. YIM 101495 TaxID=2665160 RepID=UPI001E3A9F05|nr:LCP family protein [Planomicrobium sp. YIM 101495]
MRRWSRPSLLLKKKWLMVKIVLIIFAVALTYPLLLVPKTIQTYEAVHEPLVRETAQKRSETVYLAKQDPVSFLLLGVDQRENDRGRSDTMIVLTINPGLDSALMLSIPRDTYAEIVGYGFSDKLNHAYAFGGVTTAVSSVEQLLDIPIDYFVQVNMEGFKDVVDLIGPVEVDNPFAFDEFPEGPQTLNGNQALEFVRMRYEDPDGDFGRQERQKQVVKNLISRASDLSSVPHYSSLLQSLGNNVKTNLDYESILPLQRHYRSAAESLESLRFYSGYGEIMGGVWYYRVDPEELDKISAQLKNHLEISP